MTKYFARKRKLSRTRKLWRLFLYGFWPLLPGTKLWWGTGRQPVSSQSFGVLFLFPSFRRSYVLTRLATRKQSILYWILSSVLLVANWTCTKAQQIAKIYHCLLVNFALHYYCHINIRKFHHLLCAGKILLHSLLGQP